MPAPLLTVGQIIVEACELFSESDAPTRYHGAARKHALAARRKLIGSTARENKFALLEVGNDRTVDLPWDYVEYSALGVLSDNGQFTIPLIYGNVPPGAGRSIITPAAFPHDWMRNGGFQIDLAKRRVVCNSLVPENTLLVLDYKSYAAEEGDDIAIDPLAHSWAVKYVLAELYNQKQNWQAAAKAEAARDLLWTDYKRAIRNFSLAGAMQAKHETAMQNWK